ncbi:MAG: RICIN domain-containing protein [Lewinellaceae bacterium]|nr:RICIN domain-containing protein [Saprospiraceae bacterium]MCB9341669.1 RICIN domain-containing protein [Lewinellaceae bacterium]
MNKHLQSVRDLGETVITEMAGPSRRHPKTLNRSIATKHASAHGAAQSFHSSRYHLLKVLLLVMTFVFPFGNNIFANGGNNEPLSTCVDEVTGSVYVQNNSNCSVTVYCYEANGAYAGQTFNMGSLGYGQATTIYPSASSGTVYCKYGNTTTSTVNFSGGYHTLYNNSCGGGGCTYSFTINNTGCNLLTVGGSQTAIISGGDSKTFTGTGSASFTWTWAGGSGNGSVNCSTGNATANTGGCQPNCINVSNAGSIWGDESNCGAYNPGNINSSGSASGGSGGSIVYRWQQKVGSGSWTTISGATGSAYNPGNINQTTQYRREARREGAGCNNSWITSNVVTKTVDANNLNLICEANVNNGGWNDLGSCSVTVCAGDALDLSVKPNNQAFYKWSGPNGFSRNVLNYSDPLFCIDNNVHYRFTAKHSGKVLDVSNAQSGSGANVQQWSDYGQQNQRWRFEYVTNNDGHHYFSIISVETGLALNVSGGGINDGDNVQVWTKNGSGAQQWRFHHVGNGYYQIINRNSGRALDVSDASTANGANVHQWNAAANGSNQHWKIEKTSGTCSNTGNSGGDVHVSNSITTSQAGDYTVTATNTNGCTATKTIHVTVINTPTPQVTVTQPTCANPKGKIVITNLPNGYASSLNGSAWAQNKTVYGDLNPGTYQVGIGANSCDKFINVTINNVGQAPGTACNDNNPNTTNDIIQADGCTCAGTPVACNLSATFTVPNGCLTNSFLLFADANDPYFPPTNPLYTYSYVIQPQSSVASQSSIDPRSVTVTFNSPGLKTVTATITNPAVPNCQIVKTTTFTVNDCSPCANLGGDTDGDGVCNNNDCQPNNPAFPATPGTACNDGNPNTTNDVVTADGCGCQGTGGGGGTPNCDTGISITTGTGTIVVTGLNGAPVSSLQVLSATWQPVYSCFANCGASQTVPVPAGTYYVYAKYYTAGYSLICEKQTTVTVGGGGCPDADNDGTCDADDCQPNNPVYPATPGTPCNDGNPNTTNDVVTANGCGCAGTPNNQSNCIDEKLLVFYSLDACTAANGVANFSEFTAAYPSNSSCINITANNLEASYNLHSCVANAPFPYNKSAENSPNAICANTSVSNTFNPVITDASNVYDNHYYSIKVNASSSGQNGKLSKLTFYYRGSAGATAGGLQLKSPEKMGIRVLRNGVNVFQQTGLNVDKFTWQQFTFDFSDDPDFNLSSTSAEYEIRVQGYQPDGGAAYAVGEIDQIRLYGGCAINQPTVNITGNLSVCTGQTTTLTASGGGTYLWSNGSSSQSINVGAGTYTVTVTGPGGCTAVKSATVSQTNTTVNLTNCPTNISQSVSAGSSCKVVNWTAPSATSNCGTPNLNSNFAPGHCFPIGTTTVVYTATLNGVTQTCSFTVTITSNDPCANQGGDSDGDGVCNNNDCQPNNPAFPATPGTPCNDGNPNTTNDVVTADGCGCQGTPTGGNPDCEADITITTGNGTITVSGLDGAPVSSLQIFSATWQPVYSCFANCGASQTVNVNAGSYLVYAKYYTAGYSLICEKQATVTVGGGGGTCDNVTNAGTIGFGTACTGSTTYCPNQGAASLVKNCVAPSGGAGNLEVIWLKSTTSCSYPTTNITQIQAGQDPHWTIIPGATSLDYSPGSPTQQTCYLRCARRAGCPNYVESNIVTLGISSNCGGSNTGTPDCANIGISTGPGSITVTGLDGAPVTSVQIFSASWQPEHNCFANCNSPTATYSVTAGAHYVYVKYYTAQYQLICEVNQTLNVVQALAGSQSESFQLEAVKHLEHTELLWVHQGDYFVSTYSIERSADGIEFEEIYNIPSEQDAAADVYEGYDLEPLTGKNHYRIRRDNIDGTVGYSEVKVVEYEDMIDFVLFPNPANQFTNINLEGIVGFKDVDIHIFNNAGVRMKQFHLDEVWGKYYQMDLRDLHEGHYAVWVNIPGRRPRVVQLVIGIL